MTIQKYSAQAYGGTLSDTGIAVTGIVTIAAVILLTAVVVRIWRRPHRQVALEPVETEEIDTPDDDSQHFSQ